MFLSRLKEKFKISKISIKQSEKIFDRSGIAIAAIVKNEEKYISEWARFHNKAGVSHFYIYDDNSTDNTIQNIQKVLNPNELTVIPWGQRMEDTRLGREIHNQVLAYAHAVSNFGKFYRWMTFIDIDEFIFPKKHKTLNDALGGLGDVDNISLPWHMFSTNGHKITPKEGVVASFTSRAKNPMSNEPGIRQFKMIIDPIKVTDLRVHSIFTNHSEITHNDRGIKSNFKNRNLENFYSSENIQLNHYYTRAQEDVDQKIARGPNLDSKAKEYKRKVLRTIKSIEKDMIEDLGAYRFISKLK